VKQAAANQSSLELSSPTPGMSAQDEETPSNEERESPEPNLATSTKGGEEPPSTMIEPPPAAAPTSNSTGGEIDGAPPIKRVFKRIPGMFDVTNMTYEEYVEKHYSLLTEEWYLSQGFTGSDVGTTPSNMVATQP